MKRQLPDAVAPAAVGYGDPADSGRGGRTQWFAPGHRGDLERTASLAAIGGLFGALPAIAVGGAWYASQGWAEKTPRPFERVAAEWREDLRQLVILYPSLAGLDRTGVARRMSVAIEAAMTLAAHRTLPIGRVSACSNREWILCRWWKRSGQPPSR